MNNNPPPPGPPEGPKAPTQGQGQGNDAQEGIVVVRVVSQYHADLINQTLGHLGYRVMPDGTIRVFQPPGPQE